MSGERVTKAMRTMHEAPRIAVADSNPHAGEGGPYETEEREIIAPAVAGMQPEGTDAQGPLPVEPRPPARRAAPPMRRSPSLKTRGGARSPR